MRAQITMGLVKCLLSNKEIPSYIINPRLYSHDMYLVNLLLLLISPTCLYIINTHHLQKPTSTNYLSYKLSANIFLQLICQSLFTKMQRAILSYNQEKELFLTTIRFSNHQGNQITSLKYQCLTLESRHLRESCNKTHNYETKTQD